jgi:4-hydroxy-3-methylbut-2-en-1-yl diphosphate synthase IspG/GcpE
MHAASHAGREFFKKFSEVCTKLPHRLSLEVASPRVVREMLKHTNIGQTMDTYLVSCPTCSRRPPSVERDPNSSE